MKLTETQKRFRQQMKEMGNESSVYDNPRGGNPFHKQTVFNMTTLVVVIIIGIIGVKYFGEERAVAPGILPVGTAQSFVQNPQSELNGRLPVQNGQIPNKDSELVQQLWACQYELNIKLEDVYKHHRISWDKRDLKSYRQSLLNGISTCDSISLRLEKLDGSGDFEEFFQSKKQMVQKTSLALKYYLNYLNSKNKSDNDIANNYMKELSGYGKEDTAIFTSIMDKHGYRYEVKDNGSIEYWVSTE